MAAPGVTELLGRLPLFAIALNDRLVLVAAFALVALAALGAEAWAESPAVAGRVRHRAARRG